MSSHLQWLLLRNNSAFLVKGAHNQTFTTEPNNVKGKNSFRYNGLIHNKTIGVDASEDNKGIVLTTRKQNGFNKPAKNYNRVKFEAAAGPRRVLSKIRSTIRKTKYRKDLKLAALRRASALLRGQKQRLVSSASSEKKANKKADK